MRDLAIRYAAAGLPIFRLSVGSKLPRKGSHGFLDATCDPGVVRQWWAETPQANIGLRTGRIVVVDPDGPTALSRLQAIGAPHGAWPRTLTAKTPRSIHLYYLAPADIEVRSFNEPRAKKGDDGIDVKATGAYVLLPGSKIKKDGQVLQYEWLLQERIAELPIWALEWINSLKPLKEQSGNGLLDQTALPDYLRQAKANNGTGQGLIAKRSLSALADNWSPREEARIQSALAAIPAVGYDRWVQVGMALASLDWVRGDGTSIAFDLFNTWSETAPELYSLDATEKKWASFGRRAGVGLGTLFHIAEQHGWVGNAPREVVDPPNAGGPNADQGHGTNGHASIPFVLPTRFSDAESPLIDLNDKYACIGDVGGKCLVMGWVPSKADPVVEVPSFQTFKSFAERYGHRYVAVEDEKKDGTVEVKQAQMGAFWLKWRKRKSYDGIDMVPGAGPTVNGNTLNLWRGFAVQPVKGTWDRMKAHIGEVLADGDADSMSYIMKWSAWAVQNPGERAESALVFRGGKGTGKGTFAHVLRKLFGAHGLHIANSKHLVGAFNAHLRNCLLLYADEAYWAGDKQGESTLKALITESTLTIEQKGVDAVQWRNRIHLIMTANAEWVIPASHDERRYVVCNVSDKYTEDKSWFAPLYAEMDNGGLAAMLHDLQSLDLKGWHPRQIIRTQALTEQKMQSMSPLQEWWESLLQEGAIPAAPKDTPDQAMAVYLLNHARDFAPKLRELTPTRLGRFLSDHGCIKLHRAAGNGWRFAPLPQVREQWAKRYQGWKWHFEVREWVPRT